MSPQSKAKLTKEEEELISASKEAAMAALENLLEAKRHFKLAAEAAGLDLKHEAIERFDKGREKAEELSEQAIQYAQEKPLASLGIAFAAGLIVAQLLRK